MISTKVQNEGKIEMRKQKGFSLIELLIVVAIILIIAAIAIPNLMRARMAANDSSAAASERTIVTGEVSYFSAYPTVGYTSLAARWARRLLTCPCRTSGCVITTWPRTVRRRVLVRAATNSCSPPAPAAAAPSRTSSTPRPARSAAVPQEPRRSAHSTMASFASPRWAPG